MTACFALLASAADIVIVIVGIRIKGKGRLIQLVYYEAAVVIFAGKMVKICVYYKTKNRFFRREKIRSESNCVAVKLCSRKIVLQV